MERVSLEWKCRNKKSWKSTAGLRVGCFEGTAGTFTPRSNLAGWGPRIFCNR